jgi:subtilisin family serine protease
MSDLFQAIEADINLKSMKDIVVGKSFKAVSGSFHPQFVNYLSNLDAVEFVEQNQIYKAPFLANNPQKIPYSSNLIKSDYSAINQKRNFVTQWNVPSWGIARINHRDLQDLTLYTAEEAAGYITQSITLREYSHYLCRAGIHVYVLDSGIQEDHPDFEGRAHTEANFITYEDSGDHSGHGKLLYNYKSNIMFSFTLRYTCCWYNRRKYFWCRKEDLRTCHQNT